MAEMVLNYSVAKKSLAEHEPVLREALAEMNRARELLLSLMVEDQEAYEALTAARKLPESCATRQKECDVALLASIRVPQAIAATSLAILERCEALVEKVNHFLLSDLAVSCELAMATLRCAAYNIRANLPDLKDPRDRASVEQSSARLVERGVGVIRSTMPRIWSRHAKSATT
jgi:formiminotetrahydrofolate cyclodeaminase